MPKQKQRDSDDRDAEVAPKRKTRRKRDHVADALREQQLDEQQIPRDDQGFRCVECGSRRHKARKHCNRRADTLVKCPRCKEYGHSSTRSAECLRVDPDRARVLDLLAIPLDDNGFRCEDCGSRRHEKKVNCGCYIDVPFKCPQCAEWGAIGVKRQPSV